MKKIALLVILDGWGIGAKNESNPIFTAKPPFVEELKRRYPSGALQASGIAVGLPWEEEGNSEVGHLTIGAGRVIYQHFPKITLSIRDGSFFKNPALLKAAEHVKQNSSALHLAGLLSSGNVHASLDHLGALLRFAEEAGISDVRLHLFADGKDSPPKSLIELLARVPKEKIASISGRYYAMDRDMHWDRTEQAYRAITGDIAPTPNLEAAIYKNFERGLSEEFLEPMTAEAGRGFGNNDALIFFNFREDSMRQMMESFARPDLEHFAPKPLENVFIASMTTYSDRFAIPALFPTEKVDEPLAKVVSDKNMMQLHIAETEKYAHVTYFLNGYKDPPFPNEYRILIPSKNVPRHDEYPEMMARDITARIIQALDERAFDLIVANYANPDIIAHTGNLNSAIKAIAVIDECLKELAGKALEVGATMLITSDHGNIEQMLDPHTGVAETKHNISPVPVYLVDKAYERERSDAEIERAERETLGIISDIAPTILEILHIPQPASMTGQSLLPLLAYY